jgi:aminobenzoyl-glutamate utilization protein B
MSNIPEEKCHALNWIDDQRGRFSDLHLEIWRYAEPAWREYKSCSAYVNLLRDEGFEVESGSGGMPTAFAASWGDRGPTIGSFAEYDAVPGNSQQAVPYRAPREGLHPWAPGHTDPHSALGVTALAGILATKASMQKYGIKGTLKFFGEPAEKVCGSKPVHAAKGYFANCDAFIIYHPKAFSTVTREIHFGAYWSAVFTFEAVSPEHWIDRSVLPANTHQHGTARCPGAVDALCLMYTTTKYTKEAMFPHTGSWTLNEFIVAGGDATSDNLPPRFSQIQYSWRSSALGIQQQIYSVLERNARHVAAMTGCRVSVRWVTKTRVGLGNHEISDLAFENLKLVGPTQFNGDARKFAQQIQKNLGIEPMENPFADDCERIIDPTENDRRLRATMPSWQTHFAADDYVEYTWHAPTARIHSTVPVLKSPGSSFSYPAWAHNALTGVPAAIDPGIFVGAKTIAATMIDLLTQPDKLSRAQQEFRERTGGGVGGDKWVAPLLPSDFDPPIDLRWPEYIQTVRGEEWCLPTPAVGSGAGELLHDGSPGA